MKRGILSILLILGSSLLAQAQFPVSGNITAASASCLPTSCVQFQISVGNTVSGITAIGLAVTGTFTQTLQSEATVDGANWTAITGSPTSANAGVTSITGQGIWQFNVAGMLAFRIRASAVTSGTAAVTLIPSNGTPDDSTVALASITTSGVNGGLPTTVVGCTGGTCFSSPVMGAAVSVNTTTVAPFGVITTLVQGVYFNNTCAAAVTVTITDGNNVPFVGTTTNGPSFSLAAVSNLPINMGIMGHVFTSGLAISAGTANCIKLWTEGKQ